MQIDIYNSVYESYFKSDSYLADHHQALSLLKKYKRIFFVGNGGSNAICSHLMEDYAKIARFKTQTFSDPALITCYANDYGYANAMYEWIKLNGEKDSLLIAISSSGKSPNIINAAKAASECEMGLITLSGFKAENELRKLGDVNFYISAENYGIVECFHQIILHALLDDYALLNIESIRAS
jgi:D-sedoheptulose 7-phosphate isomerase